MSDMMEKAPKAGKKKDELSDLIDSITHQVAMLGLNTAIASAHHETGVKVEKGFLMADFEYLQKSIGRLGEIMAKAFSEESTARNEYIIQRGHLRLIK